MRASVIIPAYNAGRTIGRCLDALLDQTMDRDAYEVIVVDDGSLDDTVRVSERVGVRVLSQQHRGPAAARNLGAQQAQAPVVVFTDADCRPAPEWLEALLRPLEQPEIAGVKGRYATTQRGIVARLVQAEYEEKYQRLSAQQYIDFVDTYSAAYRRDLFLSSGGFDVSFREAAMEDPELSFRLAEQGHKLVFAPSAVVFHLHPDSWGRYLRRKFRVGRWAVLNGWKHPARIVRDSRTPPGQRAQLLLMGAIALAGAAGFVQRRWWGALLPLAAIFLASGFPLFRIAWATDRALVSRVPVLLLLRAAGLLAGLAAGTAAFSPRRMRRRTAE